MIYLVDQRRWLLSFDGGDWGQYLRKVMMNLINVFDMFLVGLM